MCIDWILLLKIVVVRCWIISRLSYLFISCVWFENIWLIITKKEVFGLRKIVDDFDYSIHHHLMENNFVCNDAVDF